MLAQISINERIVHWIHRGGCPALFGVLLCCGLGLPLPEDIPLITAGVLIFRHDMNLAGAAICAWAGIIGGDCILYALGRKFGPEVSQLPIIGGHIDVRRIARVEKWFAQYGIWVVAVGRLFAGIRGVMVVVAGTSRFTFWKFVVVDGLAAVVSGGLFMFLGYKFAANMHRLHEIVDHIKGAMMIGLITLVAGALFYFFRRRQARDAAAGEFPPGKPGEPLAPTPGTNPHHSHGD